MPNTKSKFNSRFPPARIKKIMQTDEEVGKVAVAVPVLISKALEHFIESLLIKASHQTLEKNAKTLTQSHIKQCINREKVFDFLRDLVKEIPDLENVNGDNNSPGIEKKNHRKNSHRSRTRKKTTTETSKDDCCSEEESSSTESGEEDPCSALPSDSLEATQMPYSDSQPSVTDDTTDSLQPVSAPSGPSCVFPSATTPFLPTRPTDASIPIGQYKPRKGAEGLRQEDDYDSDYDS